MFETSIIKKEYKMKTTIYYFSGTGSSLAVAKQIKNGLGECTMRSISSFNEGDKIIPDEQVGFIFPNYYASIPHPVKEFIDKLDFSSIKRCFAVINAGGNEGMGLKHLDQILVKKCSRLNYSATVIHGSNYIIAPYYNSVTLNGIELENKVKSNALVIAKIVDDIKHNKENTPQFSRIGYFITQLMYKLRLKDNKLNIAKKFSVNSKCNSCGICERVCPVQNIKVDQIPTWGKSCEDCCACVQLCPSKAIMFNKKDLLKERYIHPEVTVAEICKGNE